MAKKKVPTSKSNKSGSACKDDEKPQLIISMSHACLPDCNSQTVVRTSSGDYVCLACHPDGANAGQPKQWPRTGEFELPGSSDE